ncbi:hypothetical protein M427DRAFT_359590 [Gonapodya prolifera JEL478]|uniref:Uncharacterized protein n=1 Tax=Gonapodya prolifera (strain JEL478) TaxID=1344416 RepID=A0A139ABQ5_GONPJ|nr:hypothetical protein M427DRAFT_359590 [Gonapodya prolifera JEL478]|eukprot:KXS13905.1 hypothetical protein M427DRAFT_359590 [Gonapodya prolifera JEL478]
MRSAEHRPTFETFVVPSRNALATRIIAFGARNVERKRDQFVQRAQRVKTHSLLLSSLRRRIPGYASLFLHQFALLRRAVALFPSSTPEHPFTRFRRRLDTEMRLATSALGARGVTLDAEMPDAVGKEIKERISDGTVNLLAIPYLDEEFLRTG